MLRVMLGVRVEEQVSLNVIVPLALSERSHVTVPEVVRDNVGDADKVLERVNSSDEDIVSDAERVILGT